MARRGETTQRDPIRLLVVDDEEGMREMLELTLGRQGFVVQTAASGEAGLEALSTGGTDIVLCDVRMPQMDGLAFLRQLKARKLPAVVIMMSAFADIDVCVEAMKIGAADYISKPFKSDEIRLKIAMASERIADQEERQRLRDENRRLRGGNDEAPLPAAGMIGKSRRLREILAIIHKVADYKSTVLLLGESGTGKELLARALHDLSHRRDKPFVPINCGAIPETLLELELFGHARGAFTDASRDKRGLVEEAEGGTLFLDEIGELPLSLQVKLLRFLQEEEIRRVGDTRDIRVDVRIVAATGRSLMEMVRLGTFREDLFYRLNVLQLDVPPLRERRDDIPLLVEHFVEKYAARLGRQGVSVSREALRLLMDYGWPGNIRELENTIERAMVLSEEPRIAPDALPAKITGDKHNIELPFLGDDLSIKKATRLIERELIRRGLERTGGNRTRAAELLEISHRALLYKIKDYQIDL